MIQAPSQTPIVARLGRLEEDGVRICNGRGAFLQRIRAGMSSEKCHT
jgi:hypothetical protein